MNNKERFKKEIQGYVEEGLVRDVFDNEEFTITCIADSAYCIYFHDEVDSVTGLTWGFYLKNKEFEKFMEDPTVEHFKWLSFECYKRRENRTVLFTPKVAQKFREIKADLDNQNKTKVDLELEQKLVNEARE